MYRMCLRVSQQVLVTEIKGELRRKNLCLFFQNKDLCKVTHSILYSPFCLEGNLHALCLSKMSTVNTVFFSFFFFLPFLHVFLSHFPVGAGCGNVTEASGENLSQNQR